MHQRFKDQTKNKGKISYFKSLILGTKEKTKEVNHPIKCTLEDLYMGKTTRINVKRDRFCEGCGGCGEERKRP